MKNQDIRIDSYSNNRTFSIKTTHMPTHTIVTAKGTYGKDSEYKTRERLLGELKKKVQKHE